MSEANLNSDLVFIKLGGSLITDKDRTETADSTMLSGLLEEIANIRRNHPNLKLLLGHGSGSFGHHAAKQAGTRAGVYTAADWQGYQAVWASARRLNQIVVAACQQAGLPVLAFPPSASVVTNNHAIHAWEPIKMRANSRAHPSCLRRCSDPTSRLAGQSRSLLRTCSFISAWR